MSATKPADLTLAIQKATEGFTAIVDRPTDDEIINIRQLLLPVLITTKYDELKLSHNLSEVILPTERYEGVYSNRAYKIPSVIALYDDAIDINTTRTEVHRAEEKHKAKINYHALYGTADKECKTSLWKQLARLGTKNQMILTRFIQTSRPSNFYNISMSSAQAYTRWMRWTFLK